MSLKVTVTEQVSNVTVTEQVIDVTDAVAGPQGPQGNTGATGATGATGPQGPSGVINVTAPITNSGTSTSANIGINAGVANGVATLDGSGKIPTTQLPPLAVNDTFVVASQAAMLALTAEVGDIAVRTDSPTRTFILTASPASTLGNWQEILTPPGVTSITATAPLTGGTITSTGSIGLDQTALVLDTSQINWSAIAAWQPSTAYAKGALVEYQGIAYRRSVAGTSGTTFNSANWQQFTPTPTTSGAANSLVATDGSGNLTTNAINANGSITSNSGALTAATFVNLNSNRIQTTTASGSPVHTLPGVSGTLVSTGATGQISTNMITDNAITTAKINDLQVTNAKLAGSIAQSKLVNPAATGYWVSGGTYAVGDVVLYDYKTWRCIQAHTGRTTIPNNDTAYWQLQWKDQAHDYLLPTPYDGTAGTGSLDITPRFFATSARNFGTSGAGLTTGPFYVTWFTAQQTITVASISFQVTNGQAGLSGLTNQIGIFQPANAGAVVSWGPTASITQAYCLAIQTISTANTPSWSMSTAGVYKTTLPSSITLTAGQVYGVGYYAYATTGTQSSVFAVAGVTSTFAGSTTPYMWNTVNAGSTYGSTGIAVGNYVASLGFGASASITARLNA